MLIVQFNKGGKKYELPGYSDENDYARQILSVLTGIPLPLLISADLTDVEFEMIAEAAKALRKIPMWAGLKHDAPKLQVVK